MWVRNLNDCEEFRAGDNTRLRELMHPDKHPVNLRYSLAHAIVEPGETSIPHALKTSEVYYLISGKGMMTIDAETRAVGPGDCIYIPPNGRQFIHNPGPEPLVFLALVDPAWRVEDETVFEK